VSVLCCKRRDRDESWAHPANKGICPTQKLVVDSGSTTHHHGGNNAQALPRRALCAVVHIPPIHIPDGA
jgi:hypothetical protein